MTTGPEEVRAVLAAGDLPVALGMLDAALAECDDPELHLLRGQVGYATNDHGAARAHLEKAHEGFERAGQVARAALAAAWLGRFYADGVGNPVAARGWFLRARRGIEGLEPCLEEGWVRLATVGCSVPDTGQLEADTARALYLARRFGDGSLEAKALADGGLARVSLGRVAEGMAQLDEAMALVSGPVRDAFVAGQVMCCLFSACARSGDLVRAEGWMRVLEERGALRQRSSMTSLHCHTVCGTLLSEVGRWDDAEALLRGAMDAGAHSVYYEQVHSRAALADLRIRQGRLDDAETLLLGHDHRIEAVVPLSRLHLARGDPPLAAAVAVRGLRMVGEDRARAVPLLAVLVDAHLAQDDLDAARAAAARLASMAVADVPSLSAQAAIACARVAEASGQAAVAVSGLESALAALAEADLPLLRASLHLELARVQAPVDPPSARAEAAAALAVWSRLGTPLDARAAAVLHAVGLDASTESGQGEQVLGWLHRRGGQWTVTDGTTTAPLRATKGVRYLAELVAEPGRERHVLDLVDLVEGTPDQPGVDRRRLGDAGALLDAKAKEAYRRRIEQLREELDDAEVVGNDELAWKVQDEIDSVVGELARAVGLGGRDRKAASAAERARLNVTRAVRAAVATVGQTHPALGAHLDRSLRTGVFCSYEPAAGDGIARADRA